MLGLLTSILILIGMAVLILLCTVGLVILKYFIPIVIVIVLIALIVKLIKRL